MIAGEGPARPQDRPPIQESATRRQADFEAVRSAVEYGVPNDVQTTSKLAPKERPMPAMPALESELGARFREHPRELRPYRLANQTNAPFVLAIVTLAGLLALCALALMRADAAQFASVANTVIQAVSWLVGVGFAYYLGRESTR